MNKRKAVTAAKRRPRTGEKRRTNQPLKIDRLPVQARTAIKDLRDAGSTWQEIEELSTLRPDEGGFVDWSKLDAKTRRLFPGNRVPLETLRRWFDIRVSQVVADLAARSVQAREIAEAFAKSVVKGEDEAVLNAARDLILGFVGEDATAKGRLAAASKLIALAEMQQGRRANDIKERKVATDERKLKLLESREALMRRKLEAEAEKATKKLKRGNLKPEDLADLVQRTFGIAPGAAHA